MSESIFDAEKRLLITDVSGYSPQISRLICMMNYARRVTIKSVQDLTLEQLDFQISEKSNSIGALLLHIAAIDFCYQKLTFEDRDLTENELGIWQTAIDLGETAREIIKGNDVNYYLEKMLEVRSRTYELLKEKDDIWLEAKFPFGKLESNNYMMWFHVFEDEINHRGQINLIKKQAMNNL